MTIIRTMIILMIERFSYDLEMKTREQNRKNKRTEIERFDWFIERIQTRVAFGWLSERSGEKTSRPRTRNQSILRPDVIMQHDWPIEQCPLHIRVFFGGKTKSPRFDLFIHWLIKQIMDIYRNQFSRSYENRSNNMKLWIYAENRGVKNYMKEDHRSNRRNFCSCKKESLKKSTGFEPLTSAILVQHSYQLRGDEEVMNIWKSYKIMIHIIIIHSKCFAVSGWLQLPG